MAEDKKNEGWILHYPLSRKAHYYREGKSLCNGFGSLGFTEDMYEQGMDKHSQNCAACQKKRLKEIG